MDSVISESNARLDLARDLVSELEAGNEAGADALIQAIARERESSLFKEVGRLTRDLHDALLAVELDERIVGYAESGIPDAKERLNYVITKTEEAANRTLTAVEDLLPISEKMGRDAGKLIDDWKRFRRREMKVDEFKALIDQVIAFLETMRGDATTIHGKLSEVLIAQDYQDITGQVIRRVIELVQQVQDSLVNMIRLSGGVATARVGDPKRANGTAVEGPQVLKDTRGVQVVQGQDEVDDLLSSLGF